MSFTPDARAGRRFDYAIVFALAYISVSPLVFQRPALYWSAFFAIVTLYLATPRGRLANFSTRGEQLSIALVLAILAALVLVPLLNNDPNLSPYLSFVAVLTTSLAIARRITLPRFTQVYVNVATTLAAISLTFFIAALLVPTFPLSLPASPGQFLNYHDGLIHVYLVSRDPGLEGVTLNRNNGIAWEPGAYQLLLSFALILTISASTAGRRPNRRDTARITILVVTLISTASFTGFVSLLLIAIALGAKLREHFLKAAVLCGIAIAIAAAQLGESLWAELQGSFATRFQDYRSGYNGAGITERLSLDAIGQVDLPPWFMLGSSFSTLERAGVVIHNSVLHTSIALGLPIAILLIALYWAASRRIGAPTLLVFTILMLGFMTENLFRSPLFLTAACICLLHEPAVSSGIRRGPAAANEMSSRSQTMTSQGNVRR